VTELHPLALLAPLNQGRVVLEDGVHFLVGRNRLSVEYSPAGLVDDLRASVAGSRDLLAELADRHPAGRDTLDHLAGFLDDRMRVVQHLPGNAKECTVLGYLLRVSLGGRQVFEFLHAATRATGAMVKPCAPRGSSRWSWPTSRVTVRTASHNKVASVG